MATAKDFEKHLCCPVCLETFRTPRILPCVHTFCQSCLDAHIQSSKTLDRQSFECPMCRVRTYPVNKQSPVCDWAQEFPLNHLIVSMLEDTAKPCINKTSAPLGDEKSGTKCTPCSLQDKQEDAFCFCVNCCEYLCAECYTHHSKFKVTRSHDVLKGDEIPKDASVFRSISELTLCAQHNDREVEYKCHIHDEFICSACVKIGSHRKCEGIEDLATLADKFKSTTLMAKILAGRIIESDVEDVIQRKINDLEDANRKTTLCVEQRQAILAELRRVMDYYEKEMHKDIEKTTESEQAKIRACIEEYTSLTDSLRQTCKFADIVRNHGSNKQGVIVMETLEREIISAKFELAEYRQTNVFSEVFLPEEESVRLKSLKTLLETRLGQQTDHRREAADHASVGDSVGAGARDGDENIHFGSDECIGLNDMERFSFEDTMNRWLGINSPVENEPTEPNAEIEHSRVESEQEFSFLMCGIRKLAEYDISLPNMRQRRCDHANSVILSNGRMAFIDQNNDCLKLVSTDFKVLTFITFDKEPYDLAVTGDDLIGVAVARSVCLYKVNSDNGTVKLCTEKSFLTRDIVYSLCPVGENIGVLFTDEEEETDDTYIEIRNRNGRIVRSLDTFRNKSRRVFDLHEPYTIRCRYPDELIVSESRQLKAFGLNGNLRWFYKHNGPNVHTIAFDETKNIYICDTTAKSIHQISASSFRDHRVLIQNTGIRNPRCILINSKDRTLVVGFENNNLVQVYKFV